MPVTSDVVTVFAAPEYAPSLEAAKQVLRYGNVDAGSYTPVTLTSIVKDSEGLELLRNQVKTISVGGGPVDDMTAKKLMLNGGPELRHCYGSAEMQLQLLMRLDGHKWPYFSFPPHSGITMASLNDSSDIYKCVIKRNPELIDYQPVFGLFPDADEFHTNDLFRAHPKSKDMWTHYGRVDDVIILGTGQNLYVADMRQKLEEHPAISAALVGGHGMRKAFAIVELHAGEFEELDKDEKKVKDAIWSCVEAANETSLSWEAAHLTTDTVVIANTRRPLVRTGKGSVDQKNTLKEFEKDLEMIAGLSMASQ